MGRMFPRGKGSAEGRQRVTVQKFDFCQKSNFCAVTLWRPSALPFSRGNILPMAYFTPVSVMPRTIQRWASRKTKSTGRITSTDAAMVR